MRSQKYLPLYFLLFAMIVGFGAAPAVSAATQASPFTTGSQTEPSVIIDVSGKRPVADYSADLGDIVDFDAALIAGADYLKGMQADVTEDNAGNGTDGIDELPDDPDDAGWDWSLTSPPDPFSHSTGASPTNIYGATAQGLYYAYLETGDATYFTALQDFADFAVAAGSGSVRAGMDIKMLMIFNDLYSAEVAPTTVYEDAAKAKYDARIASQGSATAWAEYIRDVRAGQGYENGIIAWDIGIYAVDAQMLYDRFGGTYDQDADDIAEVLWQDSYNSNPGYFDVVADAGFDPTYADKNFWWYTLGLTGLLDAFAASGSHTAEIPGLVQRLQESQYSTGAISGSYGANTDDEDWQSTAYAARSLGEYDQATYQDELNRMGYYLAATQDASGGWLYSSGAHYPEIGGECTAGLYFTTNANTTVLVDDDFTSQADVDVYNAANSTNYTFGYDAFGSIQDGVDAVSGSTINVEPGTYYETIHITTDNLNLVGADRATVIIDPTGFATNNAGIYVDANNVSLSGFTLQATPTNSLPRYGVKFGEFTGGSIDDVTIQDCYRSGLDILGAGSMTINNVACLNNGGHGLALTDCNGVDISNLTVSGNAWQGVSVATWGRYTQLGTSDIVFSGSNTFSDVMQLEMGDYNNPGVSPSGDAVITYSTDILDGADVTVQAADFGFAVHGEQDDAPDQERIWFVPTLPDAATVLSLAPIGHFNGVDMYIEDIVDLTQLHITPGGTIQAAVDAADPGDDINIATGTYEEQVVVATDVNLLGEGAGSTIIQSPTTLTEFFATSNNNYPVLFVRNTENVAVYDLTIDGLGRGNSNYRFIGIGFYNGGGGIYNCEVLNIKDTPFSGTQHGVAIYSWEDDAAAHNVTIDNCYLEGFQKTGMALNADASSPLNVTVTNNTLVGYGATDITAQNGIQVWSDVATGLIQNNDISGIAYDNTAAATKWAATSILNYYAELDIIGNTVTGAHLAVYNIDGSGMIAENDLTIEKIGVYAYGIIATDPPDAVPSAFDAEAMTASRDADRQASGSNALLTVDVSRNTVTMISPDNTVTYGIEADAGYGPDDLSISVYENFVTGFEGGVNFWACQSSCDVGVFTAVSAHSNWLEGNTVAITSNVSYLTVDAWGNWFGTTDPAAVDALVEPGIDYTPWLASGVDADGATAGFQPTFTELWVDDNSPQIGTTGRIQEGVDMVLEGGTVNVAAGSYEEQVDVGIDLAIIGADRGTTFINSPTSLTAFFNTGSNDNYPVVYIHDADVDISNFTIDGLNRGNSNYRFVGVGFWNAGGSVTNCSITGITDTPFSGSQHGNGIYAYNNTGGPYALDVVDVDVDDFQKNGITLLGEGLTVSVTGCTVTGVGATTTTAQNGIQLGYGSGGTITDCTVDGIAYNNTGWVASGMLFYQGGTVDVSGCTVTNSQANIIYQETNGTVSDLTVVTGGVVNEEGVSVRDYGNVKASGNAVQPISPVVESYESAATKAAATTVAIDGASFTGSGQSGSYAVAAWSLGDDVNVSVTNSTISGWEIGLVAYEDVSAVDLFAAFNSISGNVAGMWTNAAAEQIAEDNYWGSYGGPTDTGGVSEATISTCYSAADMLNAVAEVHGTLGDSVQGLVDYCPWVSSGVQFSTNEIVHHCPGAISFDVLSTATIEGLEGANVAIEFPSELAFAGATVNDPNFELLPITQSADGVGYDTVFIPFIVKTGWLDGAASLYTVNFAANNNICAGDNISMTSADLRDTANVAISTPLPLPINVTVDCADPVFSTTTADGGFYNAPPTLDIGAVDDCDLDAVYYQIDGCTSTWTVLASGLSGTNYNANWVLPQAEFDALTEAEHCIRFKVGDDAGRGNADSCSFTWCFTKDVTAPAPPTNLTAEPGHNKVKLNWANATVDFDHTVIMRTDWNGSGHGYPDYGSVGGSAEGPYPADTTTGDHILATTGTSHTDTDDLSNATRDIYHYAAFTVDAAGNISSGVTARSTSYWLGDVAGGGGFGDYDGFVYAEDLNPLTIGYGSAEGDGNWSSELDFGPTDPGGAKDIPLPDDSINFEDGIIFAINFDAVNPAMKNSPLFEDQTVAGPLALQLEATAEGYVLSLVNNDGSVKGIHAVLSFSDNADLQNVTVSEPLTDAKQQVFTRSIAGDGQVTFDAILLGKDRAMSGSGVLATFAFASRDGEAPLVEIADLSLRDLENNDLTTEILLNPGSGTIPEAFALSQNYPNPFNPTTNIEYSLPYAAQVQFEVYNTLGQRVRTLVSEYQEAGSYTVSWDSRDDAGNRVSSGVYFYRLRTEDFVQTRKMLLLK